MMFMVEMLIYVIVAGQQIGAPAVLHHHTSFTTLEQCAGYLKSEDFATERAVTVAGYLQNYVDTHDEEDYRGSTPGITATASCVDDPRL